MEGIELYIHYIQRGSKPKWLISTELKKFLAPLLEPFRIINFEVRVFKSGVNAALTTHKRANALQFVQQCQKPQFFSKLILNGQRLIIKTSVNIPNDILVRVLKREEKALLIDGYGTVEALALIVHRKQRECKISSFAYGKWEYVGTQACYHPYFTLSIDATATFGDRYFVLTWEIAIDNTDDQDSTTLGCSTGSDQSIFCHRLQFPYSAIESTILDNHGSYALVYTLNHAPKSG
ncbi:MAG: hypothetical protein L6R42_001244 [Xanthoria sp. 1 TBL-2021]|nr:MAG: hypothetical protein L6R42_001244 [Xanthoria sp. 1 TBL-2021]